jgi:hypothetical protein
MTSTKEALAVILDTLNAETPEDRKEAERWLGQVALYYRVTDDSLGSGLKTKNKLLCDISKTATKLASLLAAYHPDYFLDGPDWGMSLLSKHDTKAFLSALSDLAEKPRTRRGRPRSVPLQSLIQDISNRFEQQTLWLKHDTKAKRRSCKISRNNQKPDGPFWRCARAVLDYTGIEASDGQLEHAIRSVAPFMRSVRSKT